MSASPELSVVIPTRNEEANVAPLLARLQSALADVDHEVIVVDDSDDQTPSLLAEAARAQPGLTVIEREGPDREGGLSTAVLRGLRSARGEFVCVMDGDLQHPPETIPSMLQAARAGGDVVVASRYTAGGSGAGLDGAGRRLISRAACVVARTLFSEAHASTDPLSGFFICRRRVVDGIEFRPVGFKILLELLVCVPRIRVRDVPLGFEARRAGSSKAGLGQGLMFLRHLRSLFTEVQGSARRWKFGLVGLSGMGMMLPLVAILTSVLGMAPVAAFLPAYMPSLAWNTVVNRRWTFADQRRGFGEGATGYLERAMVSGASMFAIYVGLTMLHVHPVAAAAAAAVAAMLINAVANRAAVHRRPQLWAEVALSDGVHVALGRVASEVRADRAYILPPAGSTPVALPAGAIERVVETRRAAAFIESATHRPQRRSNIQVASVLVAPIVDGDAVRGVLVCERLAQHPFDGSHLDVAMKAAPAFAALIAGSDSIELVPALRGVAAKA